MPIKWGSSALVCISTNSNRVLAQRSLFLQLLGDIQSYCCESTPIYGICKECMVWKIHIVTFFIFSPHVSPHACWCDVYAFMVVTMKKSGKLQLEDRVLLYFVIAQRGHNFRFKIAWSHARHLVVTDVANIYNSDGRYAWFHLHGIIRPDRRASEATKYKMKNSLSTVGLEPSTLRLQVWCSTYWASRACECCTFKWPYYIHVLPIPMFTLLYVPEWWSRA